MRPVREAFVDWARRAVAYEASTKRTADARRIPQTL
jgi:hypothetical protein